MLTPNINLSGKTVLVTGAAGFIGSNLVLELIRTVGKIRIIGIDNMNDYYEDFGFRPSTPLRDGLRRFAEWYKEFYSVKF